jgi:putative ABC transport system permease protein
VTIVKLAIRNLSRRPARTLLLVSSIALAVATALALLALSRGIQDSSREGINERGADLTVSQRDASDIFSGFVDERLTDRIMAIPGIAGVNGELAMFAPVDEGKEALVLAWSAGSYQWPSVPIARGRLPAPGERGFVLLGESLAENLGKEPGDTLSMFDKTIPVAGVTGYKAAVNRGVMLMPLADLQELSFRAGQVTVLHLQLEPGLSAERIDEISREVESFGNVQVAPTDQLLARDRNLEIFKAVANAISIIALTMGGLSVLNVLLMAVHERTRETGIMMAIGWSNRRIMACIMIEGATMGLAGSILGIPVGYATCTLFNRLPTIGAYISFQPSLGVILPSVAAGIALSALGSLYPAWRAVSQSPADALRRA